MTPRTKLSLLALTTIAVIGGVLVMRELASRRPAKIGYVSQSYIGVVISKDEQKALLMTDDMCYSSIVNLRSGHEIAWPEAANHNVTLSQTLAFTLENKAGHCVIHAYDIQCGQLNRSFILPVKLSNKYPYILLTSDEKTVSIVDSPRLFQWDVQSGKLLHQVALEKAFPPKFPSPCARRFAFSEDGKQLIGCLNGKGKIWQVQSGKLVGEWTTKASMFPIFFSPDSRAVAYNNPYSTPIPQCSFVSTATGKILWKGTKSFWEYSLHENEVFCLQKTNCEIRDVLTGNVKRRLRFPRQNDGEILRVTDDYIYTRNANGEIFRWRFR